ncbi:MAG: hypothetical protein PHP89_02630 [Candidatus Omnitrophica bacterium]|nr:hypothetical protein [Candidatus Omnitrophota bacterium]MDD4981466.1 hypothetical protein [Candidatus Omnitrophota bacterium]MDD5665157.1 hypothetical protein [Candidatus Omnitrophota bacterium]
MFLTNLIFLPAILFIGVITSYEDFTISKIRNKWVILGILYPLFCYSLLYLLAFVKLIDYGGVNNAYIISKLVNAAIGIIVAYGIWKFGAWSAGDAKLFIAYTLLIPLDFYSKGYVKFFPSLILLFNIFIPLLTAITLTALFSLLKSAFLILKDKEKRFEFINALVSAIKNAKVKAKSSYSKGGILILVYLAVFLALESAVRTLSLPRIVIVPLLLIIQPLSDLIRKNKTFLILCAVGVVTYFVFKFSHGYTLPEFLPFLKRMSKIFLLFGLVRLILFMYVKCTQIRKIEVEKLKAGEMITEEALTADNPLLSNEEFKKGLGQLYPDGLSGEQTEFVRSFCLNSGIRLIEVYKTFPFALWVFLGVIITLIFRQSVIGVAITLFSC